MNNNRFRKRSLKKSIIWAACIFSVFISLMFSLINFMVAYAIEDSFFEQLLKEEAQYIQSEMRQSDASIQLTPVERKSITTLYNSVDEVPSDLLAAYNADPKQKEYRGENQRHYHLYFFNSAERHNTEPNNRVPNNTEPSATEPSNTEASTAEPQKILVAEVSNYLIVRSLRANISTLLLILSAFMFCIALGIGYVLAKRATAPVTQLADLLTETSPEDLPTNFSRHYPDNEIGLLAKTLEQAMERIKLFIHREQHFTRDTSHELRTPITIIKNALELLIKQPLNNEETKLVSRIRLANNQMEQTINTLLSLAREENDNKVLDHQFILPSIEKAIIEQSHLLNNKPVELELEVNSSEKVACSTTVLHILLTNLISNAFHYTEQGHIFIRFKDQTLSIGDTGGGIDEDIQSNVTKVLVKGKKSQGFGIGLSLVQRLCEKYELTFNLTSTTYGVTAAIVFPKI